MIRLLVVWTALASLLFIAERRTLEDVELQLVGVEDSSSYFLYEYQLVNPSASDAVAGVAMNVPASSGHPASLPSTGRYDDLADGDTGLPPYAEVGPIVPSAWRADLGGDTKLQWYAPMGWNYTTDSVSTGDTLTGFGIRSSYLPGLRSVDFLPTMEACCTVPIDTLPDGTGVLPFPSDFEVSGWAVGPRYKPEEIVLGIVESQLTTVCDDPLWIDDASLCAELSGGLAAAARALSLPDVDGAREALRRFDALIQTNTAPAGRIALDAAYLLRLNTSQLVENLALPPAG